MVNKQRRPRRVIHPGYNPDDNPDHTNPVANMASYRENDESRTDNVADSATLHQSIRGGNTRTTVSGDEIRSTFDPDDNNDINIKVDRVTRMRFILSLLFYYGGWIVVCTWTAISSPDNLPYVIGSGMVVTGVLLGLE